MISQEMVDSYVNRVLGLSLQFEASVAREVDGVVAGVIDYVQGNIPLLDGQRDNSPEDIGKILGIEDVFRKLLNMSGYYPIILAFVSNFVEQVDEFGAFYCAACVDLPLSRMLLTTDDVDVLSNQAAVAVSVLEGYPMQVTFDLRQLLARSLGDTEVVKLTKGVSDVIRKMTKVGPIARDQAMIFFRMIGSLVYSLIEASGRILKYSYAGSSTENTRKFCTSLMSERTYTRDEINVLDNGQGVGAFINCGGYGCCHFWLIAEVL